MSILWSILWADNSWAGRGIIVLIMILGVRAWLLARHGSKGLKNDGLWLARTEAKLATELANRDDTASPIHASDLLEEGGETSLIQRRVAAIQLLRGRRVKIHLPTLQENAIANLEVRSELEAPSRTAHTAMMLGILGTFWGLAALVQDIRFALPEGDAWDPASWRRSLENVMAVMVGIKTAFSTSLVGMGTALVLTQLANRLQSLRAQVLFHLEDFTVRRLLPILSPEYDDNTLLDRVSRRVEDAYEGLAESLEHNDATLEKLSGVHETYLEIVDQVRSLNRTKAGQGFDDVVDGLAQANASVLEVAETLPKTVDAVANSQERFLERLSPWHHFSLGLGRLWAARLPGGVPVALVVLVVVAGLVVYRLQWAG